MSTMLVSQQQAFLYEQGKALSPNEITSDGTRAEACAPSSAIRDLEWNNVRALIETGGSMWQDRANGRGQYEVPRGGGVSVLYAGALWLGGLSPDQQLKIAAIRYRFQGNDYWPGPLTNDGTAEISGDECQIWDKFFLAERSDAQRHREYFDCINDPDCDLDVEFPEGYVMPDYFNSYPAHGSTALGQDYYLAPFLDYDGDGFYNPSQGDYPWFDFLQEIDCSQKRRSDPIPLFGDQNLYWIFNDKGNVHSESQGQPIGMEIRAQAFAFATNDEVNNMTFYNYTLINQGTQSLTDTYFGTWIDSDIGGHTDDFVGCDVQRGLGYAYNGNAFDQPTGLSIGYGANPPAMGVDFFEGPYQDEDGEDNPLSEDFTEAFTNDGIPYRGIGIGYGDGIVDNERYGMRKFLYHGSGSGPNGQPALAGEFYNFLRGFWKNGQRMAYGGNALTPASGTDLNIPADYMFPGDTDPIFWGTNGTPTEPWTEVSSDNPPGDRRFMQSAGPFSLEPGDFNNITVGVVYARSLEGDPFASVELLRIADDKAQALFDNCFELVSGPDAPDLGIQELNQELIMTLTNTNSLSNNFNEEYIAFDPEIPADAGTGILLDTLQRSYQFQGYQVFQVIDATVSPDELTNIDRARLIFQSDIQDDVDICVNFFKDPAITYPVPILMVDGDNEGIEHSFNVVDDAFASGDSRLVNHRTYHFMAIAYGYNNYQEFDPSLGQGQDLQYLPSRKAATAAIRVFSGIPHSVNPEAGGTNIHAQFGDGVTITRLEGRGCGNNIVDISKDSEAQILEDVYVDELVYKRGAGPVNIKVIDPTRLPSSDFELRLAPFGEDLDSDETVWRLVDLTNQDTTYSNRTFPMQDELLLLDIGLSITWNQYVYINDDGEEVDHFTDLLSGEIEFEDSSRPWFSGIEDGEGFTELNWIRSGNQASEVLEEEIIFDDEEAGNFWDLDQEYEGILSGTWAPYCLVSHSGEVTLADGQSFNLVNIAPTVSGIDGDLSSAGGDYGSNIKGLNNVDVVLTSDKSLWTRSAVLEMQSIPGLTQSGSNDAEKMKLRLHDSVDKNGKTTSEGGNSDEANFHGQTTGMGWFPGYAIDVVTGERLNVAFGEDSWMIGDNGNDMIWNPTDRLESDLSDQLPDITTQLFAGGQHWIYVFKNQRYEE
ncbi:MAG: hypothetical protein ACI9RU_003018, partial [Litorivivens sp.]